ncbi:MAG: membrane protein insertase YidC [Acidobacteriota bacterium]
MPEFKNPNQAGGAGGQDTRSFLVMIIVMFGAIAGLTWWNSKHAPPPPPDNPPAAVSHAPAAAPTLGATTSPVAAPVLKAEAETTTTVENELYQVTFSNHGAQVIHWILKNYKDTEGHPLDLVHADASKQFGYPLSLYTYDDKITAGLADALYVPSATGSLQAPASLSFAYSNGNITVHKTFTFGADYVIHADAIVTRDGQPIRALLTWPTAFGDMDNLLAYSSAWVDTSANGKDNHDAIKSVINGATLNGPLDFVGVSDQYFAAIFMPDNPADATAATIHRDMKLQNLAHGAARGMPSLFGSSKTDATVQLIGTGVGNVSGHNSARLFVGPKAVKVLKEIKTANGQNLGPVLDFGFFGPIGKYLFVGLQWVHTHIASNWGWAIVIFTVFINLILLPLRVQSMRSALKMQRIQPEVDKIKAKYKNPKPTDPKAAEMNAEVMAYQKTQGVSMFGGCVPSLVQLPLLFAFFTMMTKVVELRQAHWYWLHDLSQADPYHILPILMVITSFLVQYYTPSPGVDPQQQKMMAFMMPAFSGWMTWNYASGLALYWNVGNLIMIIQQTVMNYTSLGREMRKIQHERAARKAAAISTGKPSGPTIQGRR